MKSELSKALGCAHLVVLGDAQPAFSSCPAFLFKGQKASILDLLVWIY